MYVLNSPCSVLEHVYNIKSVKNGSAIKYVKVYL